MRYIEIHISYDTWVTAEPPRDTVMVLWYSGVTTKYFNDTRVPSEPSTDTVITLCYRISHLEIF